MFFSDFYFFYAAAKMVSTGGNPYDFEDYFNYLLSVGGSTGHKFPYPAWSIGVIYPLGIWDFTTSLVILTSLSIFLCSSVALKLVDKLALRPSLNQIKICLYTLSFTPLLKTWIFGQVSWVVFFAIGTALILVEKRRFFWGGMALSLAIMKPHISAPIILFFLTATLLQKNKGLILGFALGFIIQAGLSFKLLNLSVDEYLALYSLSPHDDQHSPILTSAPLGWLTYLVSQKFVNLTAIIIGALAGIFGGKYLPLNTKSVFFVAVPVALALAPYSYSHDFLLLLPLALATMFKACEDRSERAMIYGWAVWMVLCSWIIVEAEWALWFIFIPVIPMAAQTYAHLIAPSPSQLTR